MKRVVQANGNNGVAAVAAPDDAAQGNAVELVRRLDAWVRAQGNSADANTARDTLNNVARDPRLTTLNLQSLQLRSLPDVFGHLPHLTEVNLSGNQMLDTTLPPSLRAHKGVRILNLHGTPFGAEHVNTMRKNNNYKDCAIYTSNATLAALPAELKQAILLEAVKGMRSEQQFERLGQLRTISKNINANVQALTQYSDLADMQRARTKTNITALARKNLPPAEYQRRLPEIFRSSPNVEIDLYDLPASAKRRDATLTLLAAQQHLRTVHLNADGMSSGFKKKVLALSASIQANNTCLKLKLRLEKHRTEMRDGRAVLIEDFSGSESDYSADEGW